MSVSGISSPFLFTGFLPRKKPQLVSLLESHLSAAHALVFFESPHRIVSSLEIMENVLGPERIVLLAREMTKMYEEIELKTVKELRKVLEERRRAGRLKGEFTGVIAPSISAKEKRKNKIDEEEEEEEDDEEEDDD